MVAISNAQRIPERLRPRVAYSSPLEAKVRHLTEEQSTLRGEVSSLQQKLDSTLRELAAERRRAAAIEARAAALEIDSVGQELRAIDVVRAVCRVFPVKPQELVGPTRRRQSAWPRQAAFYLCHKYCTSLSLAEIGRRFGSRDHTTVMYGIGAAERRMASRPKFAEMLAQAEALLNGSANG